MSDLTDVKFFLASLLRPILKEAIDEVLTSKGLDIRPNIVDIEPFGDFLWLLEACPGIPASTLRIKSAAGEIPGLKKVGKRVLYEKTEVLNWIRSLGQPPKPTAADLNQAAEEHIADQLDKKNGRGKYIRQPKTGKAL